MYSCISKEGSNFFQRRDMNDFKITRYHRWGWTHIFLGKVDEILQVDVIAVCLDIIVDEKVKLVFDPVLKDEGKDPCSQLQEEDQTQEHRKLKSTSKHMQTENNTPVTSRKEQGAPKKILCLSPFLLENECKNNFNVMFLCRSGSRACPDLLSESVAIKTALPQVLLNNPFTVNVGEDADDKCTKATLAPHADAWFTTANGHLLELIATQNHRQQQGEFVSVSHRILSIKLNPNKSWWCCGRRKNYLIRIRKK